MRNDSLARNEILFCVFGPGVQKVAHPWLKVTFQINFQNHTLPMSP